MRRRLAGVIEITALFLGPIAFVLAYGEDYSGLAGLVLGTESLVLGLVLWALVTLLLEGRLRQSATAGHATRLGLIVGILAGMATAFVVLVAARPAPLLLPVLAGLYVTTQAIVLLNVAPPAVPSMTATGRRVPRRVWLIVGLVLLVVGCTASITPPPSLGGHRFTLGAGNVVAYQVEQPVPLGGVLSGTPSFVDTVQFAPDGRSVYVVSARGLCEALWSGRAMLAASGDLVIDLRIGSRSCFPGAVPAVAVYFAARIDLDVPVDPIHPPAVIDASNGESVPIEPWQE